MALCSGLGQDRVSIGVFVGEQVVLVVFGARQIGWRVHAGGGHVNRRRTGITVTNIAGIAWGQLETMDRLPSRPRTANQWPGAGVSDVVNFHGVTLLACDFVGIDSSPESALLYPLMNRVGILCFIGGVLLESGVLLAQSTLNNNPDLRAWTRTDGKSVTAQYLGVLNQNVYLKLADGRVVPCPLSSLSSEDGAFVKAHPMTYRANWQAWPASIPMISISVRGEPVPGGKVVYTTRKFRFSSDVDIGADLMKDLGRVFEMTYDLHSVSPFGILATPNNGFYQAELYGTAANYQKAGGPPKTAGVYKIKERVFLAPLDTMGVESGPKGWRKISKADYNASTVVHELTHMLTHDMLDNLPIWASEGYAE